MDHIYEMSCFGEPWFTYPDFYRELISHLPDQSSFVEVGSWKGKSSAFFVVEAFNSGKKINAFFVDTWKGSDEHEQMDVIKTDSLYDLFVNNMKPLEGMFTAIRKTSVEAAKEFADESLDAVFLDAAHDYESVKADIGAWIEKIKPNGIISGHDYLFPGVKSAVDEYFGDAVVFRSPMENCWIVQVA